jgi:hypothetical protein
VAGRMPASFLYRLPRLPNDAVAGFGATVQDGHFSSCHTTVRSPLPHYLRRLRSMAVNTGGLMNVGCNLRAVTPEAASSSPVLSLRQFCLSFLKNTSDRGPRPTFYPPPKTFAPDQLAA